MKTFAFRILSLALVLAAIAGCTSTAGAGGSRPGTSDYSYSPEESASHNSAL